MPVYEHNRRKLQITGLILVGITLMIIGFFKGDVTAVFNKATKICMECIGIG